MQYIWPFFSSLKSSQILRSYPPLYSINFMFFLCVTVSVSLQIIKQKDPQKHKPNIQAKENDCPTTFHPLSAAVAKSWAQQVDQALS